MGFPKIFYFLLAFFCIFTSSNNYGQIVFKELPNYKIKSNDSLFFDVTQTRNIISLNGEWKVYQADDKDKNKVSVNVPSIFEGEGELIFEKSFSLTHRQISGSQIKLFFLGLNYTADISVNNVIIYRHSGGEFPFSLDLPKDILKEDANNILTVKLFYELDSENTIPVKQRFLFPRNFGGILRDVYIHLVPNISISDDNISYEYNVKQNSAKINFYAKVENKEFQKPVDSLLTEENFYLKVTLISPDGKAYPSTPETKFQLKINQEKEINQTLEISSPFLWSPVNPESYTVKLEVWRGENLIDVTKHNLAIYSLESGKDSLVLNGNNFLMNGVTYVPSFYDYGNLVSYNQMEKDIRIIKETGFNTIRFTNSVPHTYYLTLCEKYGLLAFVELPLNSIPKQLSQSQNFIDRSKNYLKNFLKSYKNYCALAAIGLGSSYLPEVDAHDSFLSSLASIVKENSNKLTFASFKSFSLRKIDKLDLYGIELLNKLPNNEQIEKIKSSQNEIGKAKVLIGNATYIVSIGNTDGYVNQHSFEAQAKFFEDVINFSNSYNFPGYFLNTMFDFRGDFTSITGGYNNENLYNIGIAGEKRGTDRLSYKVISAILHNSEKVTIPIGSKKDDAPMIFIIFGIALAILIGILVNSGRKFREDASRALLRPYNFYADIRDQRMMSGYHSTILLIVVSLVSGLILSNLLYYLRYNIIFERLSLSFGSTSIMKTLSYLCWHPLYSIIWISAASAAALLIFVIIIKIASFFVRNKVFLTSTYFIVIWAFLPLVLLIPVGIILYRLLSSHIGNLYSYLFLLIFLIWIFYRLMKGIYVIFDVNAGSVYLYSILFILVILSAAFIYFEINNSVFEYLQLTFKQYNLFG